MQVPVGLLRGLVPRLLPLGADPGTVEQVDERRLVQRPRPVPLTTGGKGAQDGPLTTPQDLDLLAELGEPDGEGRDEVRRRGVQRTPDLREGQAGLPQTADRGQPRDVGRVVDPVPRGRAARRAQQTEAVVVQQRGPREPEPGGEPPDRQPAVGVGAGSATSRFPVVR